MRRHQRRIESTNEDEGQMNLIDMPGLHQWRVRLAHSVCTSTIFIRFLLERLYDFARQPQRSC